MDEVDYAHRHRRPSSRGGNSLRPRDFHDQSKYDSSNSTYFGMEETMLVSDKRKSLPRRNQRPQETKERHLYFEHPHHVEEWSSQELSGANLVARKGKRRKAETEVVGYTCPHDHMFINL